MLKYFLKVGESMFHKIALILLKICTVGVYFYDYSKTRKLLQQDRTIKRELYWYQRLEVYFFNILVIASIFIPFKVVSESLAPLLQLVCLILVYLHLNRWVFVSKKTIIFRDELIRVNRLRHVKYEKHTLSFMANQKNYKIRFPLVTKERLEKTIIR